MLFIFQVLEFQKGRLENLFWKKDGCSKCSGNAKFVCLNKEECAIKRQSCKNQGGQVDCSLGIQLAFSGTDKHYTALNSWYEVANLKQYSLYGLYSNLKGSLSSQFKNFFWWVSFSSCVFTSFVSLYYYPVSWLCYIFTVFYYMACNFFMNEDLRTASKR